MVPRLLDRLYPYRRMIVLAVHLGLVATSYLGAYLLRFDFRPPAIEAARFLATLPYLLVLRLLAFRAMGILNGYWRHVGLRDLLNLIVAASLGSAAFFIVLVTVGHWAGMPRSVVLLDWLMIIFLSGGMRFAARLLWEGPGSVWSRPSGGKRALIVGAGEAGEQLLRQMQHEPRVQMNVVGLIDDDPTTHGRHIHGVRILGGIERLPEFVRRHRVALVAI